MSFIVHLLSIRLYTSSKANDGAWRHVCLVWNSLGGRVTLYNEESIVSESGHSNDETIPGKCCVRSHTSNIFNIWDYERQRILRLFS